MQPTLCSRCKKNVAVVFISRMDGGELKNEGLCLKCAKELGINRFKDSVAEYFNHMLFSPILNNTYMKCLSAATKVDYMTRRYMWKVKY